MVIVCVAARHHETDQHREDEYGRGVEWVEPDQDTQKCNVEKRHDDKCAPDSRMIGAVLKRANIPRHGQFPGIFTSLVSNPRWLIGDNSESITLSTEPSLDASNLYLFKYETYSMS